MEEKEVQVVNKVKGSIITDGLSAQLNERINELNNAHQAIGKLEGELKVAYNEINTMAQDADRAVDEASTKVEIVVIDKKTQGMIINPFDNLLGLLRGGNGVERITIGKDDVSTLANAAVVGKAKEDVEAADQKVKKAEDSLKIVEKAATRNEKAAEKQYNELKESLKKDTDKAVNRAERDNLNKIAELELDTTALKQENDLLVDEKNNLSKERDLALEVQQHTIRMLKNQITILKRPAKDMLKAIQTRLGDWYFTRKIKRLES